MPPQDTTFTTNAPSSSISRPKVLAPTSQRLGVSRVMKSTKKTSTSTSTSDPTFPALGVPKTTIKLDFAAILQSRALVDPSFDVATVPTRYPELPGFLLDAKRCPHLPKDYFAQCTHKQLEELVAALCVYVGGWGR
ncbi:uncharacterized protein LAJ45_09492 [Morchella importuna]|uniref:uncharacterized protein n=1 Tax=Morchella importuna TaxID=1174673 RepID=UPI001E8E2F72|nr:uncharacterized protein LAJ45_09492 [Morchella importuna]KAH8146546.1 hypothetical protein LAJ45_09492 [Morchella importuna]